MNKNLAVAIFVPTKGDYGELGTGYPVAKDLILTARHVVCPKDPDLDRPIKVQFKGGNWCELPRRDLAWQSGEELDVALLKCAFPQSFSGEFFGFLSASRPQDNSGWVGAGFATAGGDNKPGNPRLVNVLGRVHSAADHDPQFELGAEFPPDVEEGWQGISGSPVFVHGKIIGVIVVCPANFRAQRLRATPSWKLLKDPEFSKAVGRDDQLERRRHFEERIVQILEESEAVSKALAEGFFEAPPSVGRKVDAAEAASKLLDLDMPGAMERCDRVYFDLISQKKSKDAGVVAKLVQFLLPAIYDQGVITAVRSRKYDIDAVLLELPASIRTVAEVIMAGVDRRETRYRRYSNDQEGLPEGIYSLPAPPESGFDSSGAAFQSNLHRHFKNQYGLTNTDPLRGEWDAYMIRRFRMSERERSRTQEIKDIADRLDFLARKRGTTYYFLTDPPADEQARDAHRRFIGALKKDYPAVVFLQLNDNWEMERNEKKTLYGFFDMLSNGYEETP